MQDLTTGRSSWLDAPLTVEAATIIPITQEHKMSDFNPDDANAVSRFFQNIADKVVLASTLTKKVEELSEAVDKLKNDVEIYRETAARLDEEVQRLRMERQDLQDENARLRAELTTERAEVERYKNFNLNACNERDRWHNDFIVASTDLDTAKREREDAQLRVMQLEDDLKRAQESITYWQSEATKAQTRLGAIHSALAA